MLTPQLRSTVRSIAAVASTTASATAIVKLVNTPKVRAGFKAGQQKLVQSKDGKTF